MVIVKIRAVYANKLLFRLFYTNQESLVVYKFLVVIVQLKLEGTWLLFPEWDVTLIWNV